MIATIIIIQEHVPITHTTTNRICKITPTMGTAIIRTILWCCSERVNGRVRGVNGRVRGVGERSEWMESEWMEE